MKIISTKTITTAHWSTLPGEILIIIAGKIVSIDDYARFSAVCRSWHSSAAHFYNAHNPQFQPLFISAAADLNRITLRNPHSNSTLSLPFPGAATNLRRRFWGTPFGWIIIAFGEQSSLFNPFTGATIPIPSFDFDSTLDNVQAFLTSNPDSDIDNCFIVISTVWGGHRYAISKVKLSSGIRGSWFMSIGNGEHDFTFFKGKWYGLRKYTEFHMEIKQSKIRPYGDSFVDHERGFNINIRPYLENLNPHIVSQVHLFEFEGDLCFCIRLYYFGSSTTTDFKLFKLDLSSGDVTQLLSLGESCLFLGNNYSFTCKASYPPARLFERHDQYSSSSEFVSSYVFFSYRQNYRIDWYYNRPFDVEVWDMTSSRKVCRKRDDRNPLCESFWIVPSINSIKFRKLEDCVVGVSTSEE